MPEAIPEEDILNIEKELWKNLDSTADELKENTDSLKEQVDNLKGDPKNKTNIANFGQKKPWLTAVEKRRFMNIAKIFSAENLISIKDVIKEQYEKSKMLLKRTGDAVAGAWNKSKSLYNKLKNSWLLKLIVMVGGLVLFWDKIKKTLTDIWNGLDPALKENLTSLTTQILELFGDVGKFIKECVGNVFGDNGIVAALRDFIKGDMVPLLRGIFRIFTNDSDARDEITKNERESWKQRVEEAQKERRWAKVQYEPINFSNLDVDSDVADMSKDKGYATAVHLADKANKGQEEIVAFAEAHQEYAKALKDHFNNIDSLKGSAKNFREALEKYYGFSNLEDDPTWNTLKNVLEDADYIDTKEFRAKAIADGLQPLKAKLQEIHEGFSDVNKREEIRAKQEAEMKARLEQKSAQEIAEYGSITTSFNKLDEMVNKWKDGIIELGLKIEAEKVVNAIAEHFKTIKEWVTTDAKELVNKVASSLEDVDIYMVTLHSKLQEAVKNFSEEKSTISDTFHNLISLQTIGFAEIKKSLEDWIKTLSFNMVVDADRAEVKVTTQTGNNISNTNNKNIVNEGNMEEIQATIVVNKADIGSLEQSIQSMNQKQEQQIEELSKQNESLTSIINSLGLFNQSAINVQKGLAEMNKKNTQNGGNIIINNASGRQQTIYSPAILKQSQLVSAIPFQ